MNNQLTQAELELFCKEHDVKVRQAADFAYGARVVPLCDIDKFAQLIQQRQGEVPILKGIGKINGDGFKDTTKLGQVVFVWNQEKPEPYQPGQYLRVGNATWTASIDQYDFSPATVGEVETLFNQLVAQALEKAVAITKQWADTATFYGFSGDAENYTSIGSEIRALIDQPVEPTSQEPRQVEQGRDELVEALETIAAYPLTRDQEMGVAAMRKIAREALANRRGGE